MDTNNINKGVSQPQNIQPLSKSPSLKPADDAKRSQTIKIKSSDDKEEIEFTLGEIDDLAIELNSYMEDLRTSLRFSLHDEIDNQVIIEIKNRETGELIRQFPPEELLQIREKMIDLAGLLFVSHHTPINTNLNFWGS